MAGALRCYLRFREIEGDPVGALRASIPVAAHWRTGARVADLIGAQREPPQVCGGDGGSRHRTRAEARGKEAGEDLAALTAGAGGKTADHIGTEIARFERYMDGA